MTTTTSAADQKKAAAKSKLDFDLHVSLIMRGEGLSKSAALVKAYSEGVVGLEKRLAK